MPKKILFIGGNGNISWHSTMAALEAGHEVWHLNRGNPGRRAVPTEVKQIRADIRNPESVMQALGNQTFDSVTDWVAFVPDHIRSDIEIFKERTAQFVFISTASAYQKPLTSLPITESTPLKNPFWQYSRDKIECENLLLNEYRNTNFPAVIVRPSHTYDTIIPAALGDYGYTIPARIQAEKPVVLHGDGTSLWTLTHSADFARGFVPLLAYEASLGHSFHITSDEHLTWLQIYQEIAAALGKPLHPVFKTSQSIAAELPEAGAGLLGDKAWCALFDNSKIKKFAPGFQCEIPFREGIQRSLEWFWSDPARMKQIDQKMDQWMDQATL